MFIVQNIVKYKGDKVIHNLKNIYSKKPIFYKWQEITSFCLSVLMVSYAECIFDYVYNYFLSLPTQKGTYGSKNMNTVKTVE